MTGEPAATPPPLRVSIAAQLDPLWTTGRVGEHSPADIGLFAEQMAAYVAQNLERFADPRGADVFVAVAVDRDGKVAAHEYRSGHYIGMNDEQLEGDGMVGKEAGTHE